LPEEIFVEDHTAWERMKPMQQQEEDRQMILRLIDQMLTYNIWKDFFRNTRII
jgi:hypothetical protein